MGEEDPTKVSKIAKNLTDFKSIFAKTTSLGKMLFLSYDQRIS